MLGIALIVLLGFILYCYRPKKLEMETRFEQSLFWAKIGTACFIGHIVSTLAQPYYSLILVLNASPEPLLQELIAYMTRNPFFPLSVMMWPITSIDMSLMITFTFLFPIVSVGLTHMKLIRPLSEKKAPSQNWFHLIGLFSTTDVGGLLVVCAWSSLRMNIHASGIEPVLKALPLILLYFSVLLLGVFAVETSGYRLRAPLLHRPQNRRV